MSPLWSFDRFLERGWLAVNSGPPLGSIQVQNFYFQSEISSQIIPGDICEDSAKDFGPRFISGEMKSEI